MNFYSHLAFMKRRTLKFLFGFFITFIILPSSLSKRAIEICELKKGFYRAGVVEYKPVGSPWTDPPEQLLLKNVANYEELIEEAANEGVDIVVFPEYGLTTLGIPGTRAEARPFLLFVPNIGINPCDSKEKISEVIRKLSCSAKLNKIYTVVNLGEKRECNKETKDLSPCPSDGFLQYNSNIVFDRNGTLIAKYPKKNLYMESRFDVPNPTQYTTFITDFGVEFGLFICFDMMFYDPAIVLVERGVKNFIFPTAWVDETPFLTAIQAQSLWAMGNGVNLLASGYHQPLGGQLGSGIFSGSFSSLNYTYDPDSGTKLITARVPIEPLGQLSKNHLIKCNEESHHQVSLNIKKESEIGAYHSYLREDLKNYTSVVLNFDKEEETICHNTDFCCHIQYHFFPQGENMNFSSTKNNYRLLAFDGIRYVANGNINFRWQVCGITRCQNETLESCTLKADPLQNDLPNFKYLKLNGTKFNFNQRTKSAIDNMDINFQAIPFENFDFKLNQLLQSSSIKYRASRQIPFHTLAIINKFN